MSSDLLAALGKAKNALALLNGLDADAPVVVPSAGATDVVDELSRLGTAEALASAVEDREVVLPIRLRNLLDWNGKAANRPTLRTAAAALTPGDGDQAHRYSLALEALSYAAACAPYLQPDQIGTLVEHCMTAPYAWGPTTMIAKLSRELHVALGHFPLARRMELYVSLWDAAHDPTTPRWWDNCSGRGRPTAAPRRNRNHEERARELQAEAGIAEGEFAEGIHVPDADLLAQLLGRELMLSTPLTERLREVRFEGVPDARARAVREWATLEHNDADADVLAAMLGDLLPRERPTSPLGRMVEALIMAYTDERGEVAADQMPDKPKSWSELFPEASIVGYPIAVDIGAFDGVRIDPPQGVADEPFVVDLIRNDNELQDNRTYMGNCTYAYRTQCAEGTMVIGKIYHKNETYNFSWAHRGNGRWSLREINGYQNQRARVPQWVADWARDTADGLRCTPLEPQHVQQAA